jgi:hypothetical protein
MSAFFFLGGGFFFLFALNHGNILSLSALMAIPGIENDYHHLSDFTTRIFPRLRVADLFLFFFLGLVTKILFPTVAEWLLSLEFLAWKRGQSGCRITHEAFTK